jgi:hypothetical protein
VIVSNTLNVKEILKIYLIEQKIYPNHQDGPSCTSRKRNLGKNPKRLEISANQKAIICPTVQSET